MNNKEKLFQELNDRMEKDLGINDELKDLDPTPEEWENFKKQLPKFVYLISEIGEDIDKRNYIVSNEKIEKAGFIASRSVEQGIKELIQTMPLLKRNQFANI